MKGMVRLKKVMLNGKKILAVVTLVLMMVCMISSVAQAALKKVGKRQYSSSKGYRSHTEISGLYDDRGYAYNMSAMASMGGKKMYVVYGSAKATANSPYILNKMNAYHGYCIGNTVMDVWIQN